jgi:predicted nucleotidyltransferase
VAALLSSAEFARARRLSAQRVRQLLAAGRVPDALRIGARWAIPADATIRREPAGRPPLTRAGRLKRTALARDAMRSKIEPTIAAMVRRIVERFSPEKVILFGSHAEGRARPDSDVDLLVVMHLTRSKAVAELEIRKALRDYPVPKDIVVTTPAAFEWRKSLPGTIERPAATRGRVVYERR